MPGESISSLAGKLHGTFHRHSEQDLERVDAVFRIATTRGCITRALLAHFGEKLEDACGTCSSCLGEKRPRQLPQSEVSPASLDEMERIQDLIADRRAVLSSPERLARFLCGISSPGMLRWRMWRRKEWGMLRRMPFEEVLAITKAQVM